MNIIDIPPDERSVAGFKANQARIVRRQQILVRRAIPWPTRKFGDIEAAVEQMQSRARQIARHYMHSESV